MDYGRRKYASVSDNMPTFMSEITYQYVESIGGKITVDAKRPCLYPDYQSMLYLYDAPGMSPYLQNKVEYDGAPLRLGYIPGTTIPQGYFGGGSAPSLSDVGLSGGVELNEFGDDPTWVQYICGTFVILYTTNQMRVGESQTLIAYGTGDNPEFADRYLEWKILSGGGLLLKDTGKATTYNAPPTNPSCTNNAVIALLCGGAIMDTVEIAVNAYLTSTSAYYQYEWGTQVGCYHLVSPAGTPYDYWNSHRAYYDCEGVYKTKGADTPCGKAVCDSPLGNSGYGVCVAVQLNHTPVDNRTAAQIAAGCCPASLL